jgi:hypothetical protein
MSSLIERLYLQERLRAVRVRASLLRAGAELTAQSADILPGTLQEISLQVLVNSCSSNISARVRPHFRFRSEI